jgi:hypothetical protein
MKYTATKDGYIVRRVECEKCQRPYHYRLDGTIKSTATSPLFLDNKGAASAAADGANDEALLNQLERSIRMVPCPNCGQYQSNMVRYARKNWSYIAVLGSLPVQAIGILLYVDYYNGRPLSLDMVRLSLLAVGLAILALGLFIGFIYSPNLESAEKRKLLGSQLALDEDALREHFRHALRPRAPRASFYVDRNGHVSSDPPK